MSAMPSAVTSGSGSVPLRSFNRLPTEDAIGVVRSCLPVDRWVWGVVGRRPYPTFDDLLEAGRDSAYPFARSELATALGHLAARPLSSTFAADGGPGWRSGGERLRRRFLDLEATYERRFGHPFLIRLPGRSAAEVLDQLERRLGNDPAEEDRVVGQQLRQIALLGLSTRIVAG